MLEELLETKGRFCLFCLCRGQHCFPEGVVHSEVCE